MTLQITNGEITGSSCEAVAAHFAGLPRENRIVCELGPGMNPNVTDLCGYTLLDEKMAGTFHIAVGANTMFGGENRATDHGDFVGRQTLRADDRADEAAFEKIRANVYDSFRTVLSVAEKTCGDEEDAVHDFFELFHGTHAGADANLDPNPSRGDERSK